MLKLFRQKRHGRKIRGVSLLETLAFLSIALMTTLIGSNALMSSLELQRSQNAAEQFKTIEAAVKRFAVDQQDLVQAQLQSVTSWQVPPALMQDYLPVRFGGQAFDQIRNPYNQSYVLHARRPVGASPNIIEYALVTVGGNPISNTRAPMVASVIGANAGVIPPTGTTIRGVSNSWAVTLGDFGVTNTGAGRVASLVRVDRGQVVDDYIYRFDQPGVIGNQMATDLNMTTPGTPPVQNDINNVGTAQVTTTRATNASSAGLVQANNSVTATGEIVSGQIRTPNRLRVQDTNGAILDITQSELTNTLEPLLSNTGCPPGSVLTRTAPNTPLVCRQEIATDMVIAFNDPSAACRTAGRCSCPIGYEKFIEGDGRIIIGSNPAQQGTAPVNLNDQLEQIQNQLVAGTIAPADYRARLVALVQQQSSLIAPVAFGDRNAVGKSSVPMVMNNVPGASGARAGGGFQTRHASGGGCKICHSDSAAWQRLNIDIMPPYLSLLHCINTGSANNAAAVPVAGVNNPPVWVTRSSLPTATAGLIIDSTPDRNYAVSLSAYDPEGGFIRYEVVPDANGNSDLPPGIGLIGNVLGGFVPMGTTRRTYNFNIRAIDTQNAGTTQAFSIRVVDNQPPQWFTEDLDQGYIEEAYRFQLYAEDPDGPRVFYQLGSGSVLPDGLRLIGDTIRGTPTETFDQTITIEAVDVSGAVTPRDFRLLIGQRYRFQYQSNLFTGDIRSDSVCYRGFGNPFPPSCTSDDPARTTGCTEGDTINYVQSRGSITVIDLYRCVVDTP